MTSNPANESRLLKLSGVVALGAAVMMGYHVAARSTRDALFLSQFEIRALPFMAAGASLLSMLAAIDAARRLAGAGRHGHVPRLFLLSSILTLVEWWLLRRWPAAGTIAFYLHVSVLGPLLVSGFWTLVNEEFDPRTIRRAIGPLSAIATLGGLVAGLIVERTALFFGLATILPGLAIAHGWCAWFTAKLDGQEGRSSRNETVSTMPNHSESVWNELRSPHLRNLGLIVLGSSAASVLLDYVFKASASGISRDSLPLVRIFLGYNILVALGTCTLQLLLARIAAGPSGAIRSIGTLPAAVLLGAATAIILPATWLIAFLRVAEATIHSSLFRGGYEMIYTGVSRRARRGVRVLIDVGYDRLGDITSWAVVSFVLFSLPVAPIQVLLTLCVAVAAATLMTVARLGRSHVASLADSLRGVPDNLCAQEDAVAPSAWPLESAMGSWSPSGSDGEDGDDPADRHVAIGGSPGIHEERPDRGGGEASQGPRPILHGPQPDQASTLGHVLRSGNAAQIRQELAALRKLDPEFVPIVIQLLATEELAGAAAAALVPVAERHAGQLVDALLDSEVNLTARVQVASILATCRGGIALEGLLLGIEDPLFDVRTSSSRALRQLLDRDSTLTPDGNRLFRAVERESRFGRQSQYALDSHARHRTGALDQFLQERLDRTLEHIFSLLAMALPGASMEDAHRGIRSPDPALRSTALEYLEGVLPGRVRDAVWPLIDPPAGRGRDN